MFALSAIRWKITQPEKKFHSLAACFVYHSDLTLALLETLTVAIYSSTWEHTMTVPGLTLSLAPVEAGRADGSVYTALLTCILIAARFWLAKFLRMFLLGCFES
jgi:hypothetical protein